jgi:hypothetical protein
MWKCSTAVHVRQLAQGWARATSLRDLDITIGERLVHRAAASEGESTCAREPYRSAPTVAHKL